MKKCPQAIAQQRNYRPPELVPQRRTPALRETAAYAFALVLPHPSRSPIAKSPVGWRIRIHTLLVTYSRRLQPRASKEHLAVRYRLSIGFMITNQLH
jgi:hypothetical protein